jgi:hypothetical protein
VCIIVYLQLKAEKQISWVNTNPVTIYNHDNINQKQKQAKNKTKQNKRGKSRTKENKILSKTK